MLANKKVLIIIPRLYGGGAERLVIDLAKGLDQRGYQATLCCLKETEPQFTYLYDELKTTKINVLVLGQDRKINLLTFLKLYKLISKLRPDIIHTNLFGADLFGAIAGRLAGCHKIISTELNINFSEGKFRMLLKRLTAPLRTHIVAVSKEVEAYAVHYEGAKPNKISVIYNGVEIKPLNNTKQNSDLIIGAAGRLSPQKNFSLLIEAMALLKNPNVSCEIAGEGEEKLKLQALIEKLGLNNQVKLVGWQKDIRLFFQSCSLIAFTSLWEGNSIALLNAGEAGLPVVISDIECNREVVEDEKEGLYFNVTKVEELVVVLNRLLSDELLRQKLGNNFRQKIERDFSLNKMIESYYALYEKL